MFFSSNGTIGTAGRYLGANSDVALTQFENIAIVVADNIVLEFIVRLNTGAVSAGQTITFTLYNQVSDVAGTGTPVPGVTITLIDNQFCGSILTNAPITMCSTLAVRVTSSMGSIQGASAAIRFASP